MEIMTKASFDFINDNLLNESQLQEDDKIRQRTLRHNHTPVLLERMSVNNDELLSLTTPTSSRTPLYSTVWSEYPTQNFGVHQNQNISTTCWQTMQKR